MVEHSPCKRAVVSSILTGGSTKAQFTGHVAIPIAIKIAALRRGSRRSPNLAGPLRFGGILRSELGAPVGLRIAAYAGRCSRMMPGLPERRPHDYLRHGITTLLAATSPLCAC